MTSSLSGLQCQTLLKELPHFFVECLGDPSTPVSVVRAPEQGEAGSTIFCANPRALATGLGSQASILVVPKQMAGEVEGKRQGKTILLSTNVERAMSEVIKRWFLSTPYRDPAFTGIHPTAVIHETTKLGANIRVGPHAVIGRDVRLGDSCSIGANSVIESGVEIGNETTIHPLVYIGHHSRIGQRCEVLPNTTIAKEGFGYAHDEKGNHYRIPHQGIVVLEDDVHIGSGCSIDRSTFAETRIGAGTKVDNQVHIAHNCQIGRNSLLTAGFAMAGSSRIGANFVTGGGTVVTGHIEIVDNVQVAGMSVCGKGISQPGQYGGNPLVPLSQHLKIRASLAHLPQMRKQLALLVKKFMPELKEDQQQNESGGAP